MKRKIFCVFCVFCCILCQGETPAVKKERELNAKLAEKLRKNAKVNPLEKKLHRIIIPELELEETDLRDVVKLLTKLSGKLSEDKRMVNIVLLIPPEKRGMKFPVTVTFSHIPLYEALRYLAMANNFDFKVEKYAVVMKYKEQKARKKKKKKK